MVEIFESNLVMENDGLDIISNTAIKLIHNFAL